MDDEHDTSQDFSDLINNHEDPSPNIDDALRAAQRTASDEQERSLADLARREASLAELAEQQRGSGDEDNDEGESPNGIRDVDMTGMSDDGNDNEDANPPNLEYPEEVQSLNTLTRDNQTPAPLAASPSPESAPSPPSPTNPVPKSDQLSILRQHYLRNPNPTSSELTSLSKLTGRSVPRVKEYFRQRKNKLRGLGLGPGSGSGFGGVGLGQGGGEGSGRGPSEFGGGERKLKGSLDDMDEPNRAMTWLKMCYKPASTSSTLAKPSSSKPPSTTTPTPKPTSVPQLEIYQSYRNRFDPNHRENPLLGGTELINLVCVTFAGSGVGVGRGEEGDGKGFVDYVVRGLREKSPASVNGEGHEGAGVNEENGQLEEIAKRGRGRPKGKGKKRERDVEGTPLRDVESGKMARGTSLLSMEEYVTGMPEPLRASTWLLHNYDNPTSSQPEDSTSTAQGHDQHQNGEGVSQMDLYASYTSRFGEIDQDPEIGGSHGDEGGDGGGDEQGRGEDESDRGEKKITYKLSQPVRLITPVELIQLTKMGFPKSEAVVDEDGKFVIRGLVKREGVGKYKAPKDRNDDIFPFGLLDLQPDPSETRLKETMKRKLDQLDQTEQSAPKRHNPGIESDPLSLSLAEASTSTSSFGARAPAASHMNDFATTFGQQMLSNAAQADAAFGAGLGAADRELVEGLRRFKDSRLGREVRDVCVQQ